MAQYRPYVSRTVKSINWIKANAKWAWTNHPEEFAGYAIVVPLTIIAICKVYNMNGSFTEPAQPYYRYRYEVRRPDDPIVVNWRPPTDYPPPYLSNPETKSYKEYLRGFFTSKTN
uniref:Uncharacterized protein n=1 Tax=Ditylenchus dipsaci TaxID=166011 RepID=A0A915E2U3_9BILA